MHIGEIRDIDNKRAAELVACKYIEAIKENKKSAPEEKSNENKRADAANSEAVRKDKK